MTRTSVAKVAFDGLPPLRDHATTILPDWAADAVRVPVAQPWAENRHRFAVTVIADTGERGRFGPVSQSVATIIHDEIAPVVVGRDVMAWRGIADLRPRGRHVTGAHARVAVSATELALWDLRSRMTRTPVGELLGGRVRNVIPAYATASGIDIDHPLATDVARWIAQAGFWAQKWTLPGHDLGESPTFDASRLERLRGAIGPEARLCIDVGGRWDAAYARQMLPVLAEQRVSWIEEPGAVAPDDLARFGLAHAAGEHDYDPTDQLRTLTRGHVQIWQPDPSWNGGLAHTTRMVDLASMLGIPCLPHGSGLDAGVHLASIMPSAGVPAVEYHLTLEPLRQAVHVEPLVPHDGAFALTGQPGLTSTYCIADAKAGGSADAA